MTRDIAHGSPEDDRKTKWNDVTAPDANQSANPAVPSAHTSTTIPRDNNLEGSPGLGGPLSGEEARVAELRIAASAYHAFGFNVLTLDGAKQPNIQSWSHLQNTRQTRRQLEQLPFYIARGLGVISGDVSGGPICLDFDHVEGDRMVFAGRVLEAIGLPSDYPWVVISPGGVHVWAYVDGIESILGGKGKITGSYPGCDHVELRARGHQTCVPPTIRTDGGVYRFANSDGLPTTLPEHIDAATVSDSFEWAAALEVVTPAVDGAPSPDTAQIVGPGYAESAINAELDRVRNAQERHRNDTLFSAALNIGTLLHLGIDESDVAEELVAAAAVCGLAGREARNTVRSGLSKGSQKPRKVTLAVKTPEGISRRAYPLDVLPEPARTFVAEAAQCIGCPPEMVAVPLVGYAAAAIGSTYRIQIKRDYLKFPVLWFVVVGDPGSGKSPADSLARRPLESLQGLAVVEFETKYEEWKAEHGEWAQRMSSGQKAGIEPEKPKLEHFFTTDATIEALAPMLKDSPGIAVAFDEIVGWVKSMDAYNGSAGRERAQYMTLWAERTLKVDRKTMPTIYVEDPVTCVIGGIQPDMLGELVKEAGRRDGFVDRFLWAWPESSTPRWTEAAVSDDIKKKMEAVFARLRFGHGDNAIVALSPEAKVLWSDWYDENAEATETAPGLMRGIRAKADVHLARLALVLHVLEHDAPEGCSVSAATLERAIELLKYHLAHARAVMEHLGQAADEPRRGRGSSLRQRILAALEDHGGWILASELAAAIGGHVKAKMRDAELARMLEDGLVESMSTVPGKDGGRSGAQWRLASTHERGNLTAA